MLFIYRALINFIFIISPIIFIYRFLKKKETLKSYREKIGIFEKKTKNNLIWFHGASVGEIKSIIPLIEKYEKISKVKKILITSNTLSSLQIIKKIRSRKVVHQFYPIDTNYVSKKFIDHWKPIKANFIDSEIWPNMFLNLKNKNIKINIINGRITKKSFDRWKIFTNFSKNVFSKIDLCLASSLKAKKFFKRLGVKNTKFFGNLKFAQIKNEKNNLNNNIKKLLKSKKTWCASSTHNNEELMCAKTHLILKKKFDNLLTVIIPRHVDRTNEIKKELEKLNLIVQLEMPPTKVIKKTDILLVNSYGKTKSFYQEIKNIFLGGSLINHGGQNPIEAAVKNCNIIHGPNVDNFDEIYRFLKTKSIAHQINSEAELSRKLYYLLNLKTNKNNKKKLIFLGEEILKKTFNAIN